MIALLSAAGRSFLRAFVASLTVLGIGILWAPDLAHAYLIGVAALVASFAAGLRALTAYWPQLSLVRWLGHPFGDWADSFVQAFVGSLIVTLPGIAGAPNFATEKSFLVAAVIGAFGAAARAVQGAATPGEHPAPGTGLKPPPNA
jgi:hypothetical protein